jgi:hypothetical protein
MNAATSVITAPRIAIQTVDLSLLKNFSTSPPFNLYGDISMLNRVEIDLDFFGF